MKRRTHEWSITRYDRTLKDCGEFIVRASTLTTREDNTGLIEAIKAQLLSRVQGCTADTLRAEDYGDEIAIYVKGRKVLNLQYEGHS